MISYKLFYLYKSSRGEGGMIVSIIFLEGLISVKGRLREFSGILPKEGKFNWRGVVHERVGPPLATKTPTLPSPFLSPSPFSILTNQSPSFLFPSILIAPLFLLLYVSTLKQAFTSSINIVPILSSSQYKPTISCSSFTPKQIKPSIA